MRLVSTMNIAPDIKWLKSACHAQVKVLYVWWTYNILLYCRHRMVINSEWFAAALHIICYPNYLANFQHQIYNASSRLLSAVVIAHTSQLHNAMLQVYYKFYYMLLSICSPVCFFTRSTVLCGEHSASNRVSLLTSCMPVLFKDVCVFEVWHHCYTCFQSSKECSKTPSITRTSR